ncbi:MAG TPA: SRPBCC domain-containing protein [Rhizomicrobium sp.]|nr:SRPBCC domain-containing protein [Rhizomicrobium sp.]
MSRSVTHASFTITRHWNHAPARVFEAFAKEEAKRKWFAPGVESFDRIFDFREGGRETMSGKHPDGKVSAFDCVYRDIVTPTATEAGRIIYSYVMHLNGAKISVSQAAIEILPEAGGTKLVLTEYGDYLDGYDDAGSREHGTNWLMDLLEKSLTD